MVRQEATCAKATKVFLDLPEKGVPKSKGGRQRERERERMLSNILHIVLKLVMKAKVTQTLISRSAIRKAVEKITPNSGIMLTCGSSFTLGAYYFYDLKQVKKIL